MDMKQYNERVALILENARHMKEALLKPIIDEDTGGFISDARARNERLAAVTENSIFELAGKQGSMIQSTASNAIRAYCTQRGYNPSDELLASAYQAISNILEATNGNSKEKFGRIFESGMSSTEGVLMRDRLVALILPVMLQSITSDIVTHIPGHLNQSEVFRINRIAGSTFGDYTAGEKIDYDYGGQYSNMDVRYLSGTGDGEDTGSSDEFDWDSNTVIFSGSGTSVWPMKKKSVRVLHDRNIVAQDDGSGSLYGSFKVGESTVNVTGTVNYDTGTIHPVFSVAPANGIEIHVTFDVNIEKDPTLIPLVDHEMDSVVLYPHESAIAADVHLQALWGIRREYNLNAENMAMTAMRNLLAADKDRKRLNDMYFYAKDEKSWVKTVPDSLTYQEHIQSVHIALLEVNATLMNRTGRSGLVGIIADKDSGAIFKGLGPDYLKPVPGYQQKPQPHYVGRLFDKWDLYEDPQGTSYESLCFGKGANHGESGYVAGDAIPAISFNHTVQRDLIYKNTLWELAYRDLNPFDGRNYFMKFKMTSS